MSGVVLAVVGLIGLVGNVLVVIVYTSANLKIYSTSIYLTALAVSDFLMIDTAMFLFVLEAWRHHGPLSKFLKYNIILIKCYSFGVCLWLRCAFNFSTWRNISNNVCIFLCGCSC